MNDNDVKKSLADLQEGLDQVNQNMDNVAEELQESKATTAALHAQHAKSAMRVRWFGIIASIIIGIIYIIILWSK